MRKSPLNTFKNNIMFRKNFAEWMKNYFIRGKNESKNTLRTLMSSHIDSGTVDSIISKREFYHYIRVMKDQSSDIMDLSISALKFNPDGSINFSTTSNIFLSNLALGEYRMRRVNKKRREALTEFFSPKEIETLLKFSPKGTITIIELIKLIQPSRNYAQYTMNILRIKLYGKRGAKKSRLNNNLHPEQLDSIPEAETLSAKLNELHEHEIFVLRKLSIEELNFLKDIEPKPLEEIRRFVIANALGNSRQNEILELSAAEKRTLCKAYRKWWVENGVGSIKLPHDKFERINWISASFLTLTRSEWFLLKSIAPLTESEIKKLSTADINLIVNNDKFRETNILKKFLSLDESERKIIANFDMESGRGAETLSGDGKILILILYGPPIQTFLAPIIWRSGNLKDFKLWFQGMKIQSMTWNDRLNNARLLALAMASQKSDGIHEAAEWLRTNGGSDLFYYLRLYQYTGCSAIRNKIRWCRFPTLNGPIFDLSEMEDLHFFTWILKNFHPLREINFRRMITWTLKGSQHESLREMISNRLRLDEYQLTRKILFFGNDGSDWLTDILKAEDTYEFFKVKCDQAFHDQISRIHPGLIDEREASVFTLSVAHGIGDSLPLLKTLSDDQLSELFHEDPITLLRSTISIRRVDFLEFFDQRIRGFHDFFVSNRLELLSAFTSSMTNADSHQHISVLKYFSKVDPDLYRQSAQFYLTSVHNPYLGQDDVVYRLFDSLNDHNEILTKEFEISNPDVYGRLVKRSQQSCRKKSKRDISSVCIDSEHKVKNPKESYNVLHNGINKGANTVGLIYTLFSIGKHVANVDIEGITYDNLNLWVMPKFGETISDRMLQAGLKFDSPLMKNAAPVMGRVIGNFLAFVGLYDSLREYGNATGTVDMEIADLHIITNSIYIIADVPAVVTGVISEFGCQVGLIGAYASSLGLPISVGVLIVADFIESAFQVEKLSQQIRLTDKERLHTYWTNFFGRGVAENLKCDIEAKNIYESYIRGVLSICAKYGKVVIFLPDILVTQQEYVPKSGSNDIESLWYRSFITCRRKKKIVHLEFDFEDPGDFSEMTNVESRTRLIPDTLNDYNLTFAPNNSDVYVRSMKSTTLPVPSSEKCFWMPLNDVMEIRETVEKWFLPNKVISYERSGNSSTTLFYIPTMDARITSFTNENVDIYFRGVNISILDHGNNTDNFIENRYHFTNELIDCKIHKQGKNYFYISKNKFDCELLGDDNVIVVKDDFEDSRNMSMIVGSKNSERLNISYAKYVDGRGGEDTITGDNYTLVRSYWGDSILGQTMTILPLNVTEIRDIVFKDGFIVHNNKNQTIKVGERSTLRTLDSFIVTPIKINNGTVTDIHLHKFVQDNVVLDEQLNYLRKISNFNFKMVRHLSSLNYEIIIGETGHNIFYPNTDKENMNFYWEGDEGTSHVYLLDRLRANITISQANGLLDFQLLKDARGKTVIEEKHDLTIVNEHLHVKVLNNYQNITFAMDGKYYKLRKGVLEQDYCSHPLRITGKMKVKVPDLKHHYNCFEFKSEGVLFFKLGRDLILYSGEDVLSISDYNLGNFDLSLRLNGTILTPVEFLDRAEYPNTLKLYRIDKKRVEIYHNQPVNRNDIGIVDLSDKSISDFHGKIQGNDLFLVYQYGVSIVIRNWLYYPEARRVMFIFKEGHIDNVECIVHNCEPDYFLDRFQIHKDTLTHGAIPRMRRFITFGREPEQFDDNLCTQNLTTAYLISKYFLDRKYPLPKFSRTENNIYVRTSEIVEKFQEALKNAAQKSGIRVGEIDCFDFYMDVIDIMKTEEYSRLSDILYSTAKSIVPGNEVFLNTLKDFLNL